MHRHGFKGRKFGRETDQRTALIRGLATALVDNGSIETTLHRAKETLPYVEVLITKAKKGDLHNRRQIVQRLSTLSSAHRLVDEIAPKLKARDSGYLKIEKTTSRRGDNAQMAKLSFVDDLKQAPVAKPAAASKAKVESSKPKAKTTTKVKK
jgi:large subunit ribosomal protein L17